MHKENLPRSSDRFRLGLASRHEELVGAQGGIVKGEVFMELRDGKSGELLDERHIDNLILLDAGILIQMLLRDPTSRPAGGINMLAVGTGATGALLSPDAPDSRQRKLNAEIERKGFVSTTFRSAAGAAVAYPTNVGDYVTSFAEAEAVGPLNEMSLISAFSSNTAVQNLNPNAYPVRDVTVDVSTLDIDVNRLCFSVLTKSSTAVLAITWRLTS